MPKLRLPAIAVALTIAAASIAFTAALPTRAEAQATVVKAGYGEADATWHVGAGAGQYTAKSPDQINLATGGDVDPQAHSTTQKDSHGVQSRLSYRAIVVEDTEGDQVAFVKSDSYLAQDYLTRRVGQILAANDSSVSYEEIMLMASHNHSSPYYTTPSWGVWVFQDVFDLRAFEYHARQIAAAILQAESSMVDARMGATAVTHKLFKGMVQDADVAPDGSPVGYPDDFGDLGLSVIRFDNVEDPANPKPLATLINWGQHPEGNAAYDLITGDYVAALERFVERATGSPLVFGQGDVGSSEGASGHPQLLPDGMSKEFFHVGHSQTERGAYLLSRDVIAGYNAVGAGTPVQANDPFVPFSSTFDVEAGNAFVPGPVSHPYPSVSNCRTHPTAEGNPGAPVLGLPDCKRAQDVDDNSNMLFENLKAHGIPIPEHYDAPAFTGVEENLRLKLQAFRMGEVVLASCACEAQVDLILNFETRADNIEGNIWDGYDWRERLGCAQNADSTWTCNDPRNESNKITFSDKVYQRMVAEIHNDAKGWDLPENAVAANEQPDDPTKIWGNFTKEELPSNLGYELAIGVGHASDYNGYTVSYREYMRYDDYRKALTSYGPHTADYMSTRMVRLAGELKGGPALSAEINDAQAQADEFRQQSVATALGQASSAAYDAWVQSHPDDVGPAEPVGETPKDITHFDGTSFSWRGGSNAVDNPHVRVERLVNGTWQPYADQSGEIQTRLEFPNGADGLLNTYAGNEEWIWTANFEALASFPAGIENTPAGEYRFVVDGRIRQGGANEPYHLESDSFTVSPWSGIEIADLRIAPGGGSASFTVPSYKYPLTYDSVFPEYINTDIRRETRNGTTFEVCFRCSFRPWATSGEVVKATITVLHKNGKSYEAPATYSDGRWSAPLKLKRGDIVYVGAGDVVDNNGETNGSDSARVAF